jgi:hypothetical protein
VVDGSWHKRYLGGGTEYYDSSEVLTDKNGEFKIGHGLIIHSIFYFVQGMDVTIFKAGYMEVDPVNWQSLKQNAYTIAPNGELKKIGPNDTGTISTNRRISSLNLYQVAWQGNKAIFKLLRMTLDERRQRITTEPLYTPSNKRRLFELENNKENIEIGSDKDSLYPEELLK